MFTINRINDYQVNILANKKKCDNAISPKWTHSPFTIPEAPPYISIKNIKKITNLYVLKRLEYEYDNFLEKKCHILLLLNMTEDVFELRDAIVLQINALKRQSQKYQECLIQ